jgi:Tfp pilus assembly protein PilO
MNSWIPKNKIVRFAAATALLSIILYFAGLLIVFGEIKKVENFYNDTESQYSKEEKTLAIKSIAETDKEQIQTLRDFFVKKGDEVTFIEQIEKAAKDSSIKFEISSIDIVPNQRGSFKEDLDVKMKAQGSWQDVMFFINKLEKMPFGVLIENLNLDASAPGSWEGLIDFNVFREK